MKKKSKILNNDYLYLFKNILKYIYSFNELYNYLLKCLFYLSCHQNTIKLFHVNIFFSF